MKNLVILTGAGMSAESGLKTFRDAGGLWEGHNVMEVASPEGYRNDPALVLEFYNQRRRQLKEVSPNLGHLNLKKLEDHFHVDIVTQNVDDLHERAGSTRVLHLHGQLRKVRSTYDPSLIYDWEEDLVLGDRCEKGSQLRPHIVWFGEAVPMIEEAISIVRNADVLVIIGTSMQVYPAAGLIDYIQWNTPIYFIDPKPAIREDQYRNLSIIENNAAAGTVALLKKLIV
jgi:NAD-dependent deacetylase